MAATKDLYSGDEGDHKDGLALEFREPVIVRCEISHAK